MKFTDGINFYIPYSITVKNGEYEILAYTESEHKKINISKLIKEKYGIVLNAINGGVTNEWFTDIW